MVHLILIASPSPSHVLPLYGLARRLVAEPGISVTFLGSQVPIDELRKLGALPAHNDKGAVSIRCVALASSGDIKYADLAKGPESLMKLYHDLVEPATAAIKALAAGKPVIDAHGRTITPCAPASAVVGSPFIFFGPPVSKQLGLHWSTFLHTSPPGSGITLRLAEAAETAQDANQPLLEDGILLEGVAHFPASEFINVFGEAELTKNSPTIWLATGFKSLLEQSDSLLLNSTLQLDAAVLPHLQPRSLSHKIPMFGVGPVDIVSESDSFEQEAGFLHFLEQQQLKGRGCILASFGALGYLPATEQDDLLAAAIAETRLAFIIADKRASQMHMAAENVLVAPWVPQGTLLQHKGITAFLGHAGWNGALEALRAGVPQFVRPFKAAELVINARYLVAYHKVACYIGAFNPAQPETLDYAQAFTNLLDGTLQELYSKSAALGAQLSVDLASGASRDQEIKKWIRSL